MLSHSEQNASHLGMALDKTKKLVRTGERSMENATQCKKRNQRKNGGISMVNRRLEIVNKHSVTSKKICPFLR